MRTWRIGMAGFGNVHRALAALLERHRDELLARHGLRWRVTLLATGRRGTSVDEAGIDLERARAGELPAGPPLLDLLEEAPIDLLFEATPLDPRAGEPALSHVRAALERGVSVVSANKGPLAFAARDLLRLARRTGAGFRFESTVADCLPVFDLCEVALPAGRVAAFEGVLNATSNLVLQAMLEGRSREEAVRAVQARGLAEADPSHDLDGWDQAVKAVILSNVLCGRDLRPAEVERTPLAAVDLAWAAGEQRAGRAVRLLARGGREGSARVEAASLPAGSFLATLGGGALGVALATDAAGILQVASPDPGVEQTAYGMLSDFVAIHQGRRLAPSPLFD